MFAPISDSRMLADCAHAHAAGAPGGLLLVVHSSLLGERRTLDGLTRAGLLASMAARRRARSAR